MKLNWQTLQAWQKENPLIFMSGVLAIGCLLYYLIVITPLEYLVADVKSNIINNQTKVEWMSKAAREIIKYRQSAPQQRQINSESTFNIINQRINEQGWTDQVSDVRQMEEGRVQMNFKSIAFNDLMGWLRKLYNQNGIYVLETTIQKTEPGKVRATLQLQGEVQAKE